MSIVEQNKIIRSVIGPRACDRNRAFPGFTLFAPLSYLIDLDGEVIHTWQCRILPGCTDISQIVARFYNLTDLTATAGPGMYGKRVEI